MSLNAADAALDPPDGLLAAHADQPRPLASYAVLMGAFGALLSGALAGAVRQNRLPARASVGDLALLGVGSFKLSRLVGRDRITSAIRAPFTRFQDDAGYGEVDEAATGTGMHRAIGELIVCPECLGLWVAGGFTVGSWYAPHATRAVAGIFAVHALSDTLQIGYSALQKRA